MTGRTRLELEARRRADDAWERLRHDLERLIDDAGITRAAVARRACLSESALSRLLGGQSRPEFEVLLRICLALDGDLYLKIAAGVDVPIRDAIQARMIEAFLLVAGGHWRPHPEITITTPARGSVDLVLESTTGHPLLVAAEFQSQLRRLEQTIRWSAEKAAGVRSTALARQLAAVSGEEPRIGRLLVVRNTVANRAVAREFAATLAAAYPVGPAEVVAAIRGVGPWRGDGIAWMSVHGAIATLLDGPPRGR